MKNHAQNVAEKLVPDSFKISKRLAFTSYEVFSKKKKQKRSLELVSQRHFLHDFEEKHFSRYIVLTDQISLPDCLYFFQYLAICLFRGGSMGGARVGLSPPPFHDKLIFFVRYSIVKKENNMKFNI